MDKLKMCCIASSGGHWVELTALNEIISIYDSFFITEAGAQADSAKCEKIYRVNKISRRDKDFLLKFLKLWIAAIKIMRKERPKVILTTGALIAVPFCYVGKLFGSKIIYIESFARVNQPSLTGKIMYPIADIFIVQWESMLKCYPKAVYGGKVF